MTIDQIFIVSWVCFKPREEQINPIVHHDPLTGLMNCAGVHDRFAQVSAQDRFNKVALLCLDLDRFKLINEMFGFVFGDLLLQSIAERLKRFIFEGDLLARVGDDEFMMILTRVSHVEEALKLAQKVSEVLSGPFTLRNHEIMMIDFRITASIGIALAAPKEEESEIFLKTPPPP